MYVILLFSLSRIIIHFVKTYDCIIFPVLDTVLQHLSFIKKSNEYSH